jgi:hypothetical protein
MAVLRREFLSHFSKSRQACFSGVPPGMAGAFCSLSLPRTTHPEFVIVLNCQVGLRK